MREEYKKDYGLRIAFFSILFLLLLGRVHVLVFSRKKNVLPVYGHNIGPKSS